MLRLKRYGINCSPYACEYVRVLQDFLGGGGGGGAGEKFKIFIIFDGRKLGTDFRFFNRISIQ
jgi:hypothetical protein